MKELYLTKERLRTEAEQILIESGANGIDVASIFQPDKSALLILDMQDFFLKPESHAFIPSGPVILPNIKKLANFYNQINRPIIFTRHINTDKNAGMMKSWWQDLILKENPLSRISDKLMIDNMTVIEKSQYDSFYNTSLEDVLSHSNTKQLVITGVMTHLCCESTARSAFTRGYNVFWPVDGTATYNRHFHLASCRNLGHGFTNLALTDDLLEALK